METIQEKLGVLVFCPTKSRCESVAISIASAIRGYENIILFNSMPNLKLSTINVLAIENKSRQHSPFLNREKIKDCFYELKATLISYFALFKKYPF